MSLRRVCAFCCLCVYFLSCHSDVMAQIEHEDIAVMGLIKSNEWVDLTSSYLDHHFDGFLPICS